MRVGQFERKTKETAIAVEWLLDGRGEVNVKTPFPFLDHMLSAMGKHGLFDLKVRADGDLQVDDHHTIEDLGIVLGEAFSKALGEKEGIRRFGSTSVPLDEALADVAVDLSGRPFLSWRVRLPRKKIKEFDTGLIPHLLGALCDRGRMTLHVNLRYGKDPHHILEAVFKGIGKALCEATRQEPRIGIPSTKGVL